MELGSHQKRYRLLWDASIQRVDRGKLFTKRILDQMANSHKLKVGHPNKTLNHTQLNQKWHKRMHVKN